MSREAARKWYWEHGGKEKKGTYNKVHLKERKEKEKQRWKRKKRVLVDMLGGKCKKCGYSKLSGLTFHHNGAKRENISDIRTRPLEALKEELKDAELLCANCHMELHYKWLDS